MNTIRLSNAAANPAPGHRRLRESHAHIASHGESLSMLSLRDCTSVEDCLQRLTLLATIHRSGMVGSQGAGRSMPWVRAIGARVESWREPRWPTLAELDDAMGDIPCLIMSFDHHASCGGSAALRAAGLHAGQSIPPNGVVCADSQGRATGLLLEQAAYVAWAAAPEPTLMERTLQVLAALKDLASLGFVHVHDLNSQPWLGPILQQLEASGSLPVESVWLYPPIDEFSALRQPWESDRVRLAGAKLFADGTLNSRTALMLSDYKDPLPGHPRGKAMVTTAQIDAALRHVSEASSLRDPTAARGHLAVHAIGDGAVRMVLDAIERVSPRPDELGITARIEHCELIDEADIPRFASLGVVCSVQPCHLLCDVEALNRYLPHRLDRVLPLRELIESGCHAGMLAPLGRIERVRGDAAEVWFGSDVPIVRPNPDDSIQAAVNRRRFGVPESESIAPMQYISEQTAWQCFQ
ncbi:MAG: amidohydrolase family protein [Pyrinomonadaceae bacterium]|nr:amidohydrolase family protein [Phycisphaerales bacterium]